MKKNNLIRHLSTILLWLLPAFLFAQEPALIISTDVSGGAITVCGNESTATVKIKNNSQSSVTLNALNLFSSTTNELQVVAPLPPGWNSSGCASGYVYCPTNPVSLLPSQVLTLAFKVKAGCNIIPLVESGQQNFFDVKVLYNTSLTAAQQSVNSVNIFYPNYSITATPDGSVAFGQTVTRTIKVCNSGNGFNPTIKIAHTHDGGIQWLSATYEIISPTNTVLSTGTAAHTASGAVDTYTITDTNPESITDPNDQKRCYVLTEKFIVTGCGYINSSYATTWGCNNQICNTNSKSNLLVVKDQFAQLSVKEFSFTKPDFCTTGKIVYEINNYGDDPAGDILFDLPYSSNVSLSNGKVGLDNTCAASSVSIPSASPYHIDISGLTALANPALGTKLVNGKLYLDAHKSIFICFDVNFACPASGECSTYSIGKAILNYKDACGAIKPTEEIAINKSEVCWETCGARYNPDMKVGDTKVLKICYEAATSEIPCTNGQYSATYTLPAGLSYVDGSAFVDGSGHNNVTVSGNTVTLNGIENYQGLKCFEIRVQLNCEGSSAGSPIIKEFLATFKLNYQCDKNSSCCNITAGTHNFKIYGDVTNCPDVYTTNCLQTTSFTVKRNTFGIDPITNQPANANTSGIALDRAYPCDELLVCAKSVWVSSGGALLAPDAFINIEFEQPSNLLQYVSGTIEIVDNGGNVITSCAAGYPITSNIGDRYTQRFNVPCGAFVKKGFGISLCAKYKVLDNPAIGHGTILSVFRGTYGYKDASGNEISCLGKGDYMILIRPTSEFKLTTSSTQAKPQCEPVKVTLTWKTETCYEDDFPNEIRNINKFVDYKLNYPPGYNLLDAKYVNVTCNGTTTLPIKGLPPGDINCSRPFSILPQFPLVEKCSGQIEQRLEFNLQATCVVSENSMVSTDITYKEFPGSDCENQETQTVIAPIINNQPKLSITALPTNVDATSKTACWKVRVSNGSFDIPANQAFLKFPTCSGITVTSIADITNGGNIDLTSSLNNGQLALGVIGAKQEKFYQICGTYKCTDNGCPIELSWTCGAPYYCSNASNPQVCTPSQTIISVTPKEGLLQTEFIAPTDIPDICKDVTVSYIITNVGANELNNIKTKIISFPTCWTVDPTSVCVKSLKPGSMGSCNPAFDLLSGIDLGTLFPGDYGLQISFKIKTTCAMLNCTSAAIVMQTTAQKACGDVVTNTFTSKNLIFKSKPDYSYTPLITAEPFTYCTSTDVTGPPAKNGISKLTFSVTVNGPITNTAGDLIDVNMPKGFQYVANSFKALTTVGGVTLTGSNNNCTTGSKVNLKINNAVAAGGIITFTMNVTRCAPTNLACDTYTFSTSITQNDTRTCTSPVLNCVIGDGKVTNNYEFYVIIKKPSFVVSNVTEVNPLGLCNTTNNSIRFTLTNVSGLALASTDQVPIEIYCSTGCPGIICGSTLPAGVTLLKTVYATPGSKTTTTLTTSFTTTCKTGTNLIFRVGATCSPAVCFCPTTYCHTLVRPTVKFTVANICKGSNLLIVNNSSSLGQSATYTVKIKSSTGTTLYTFTSCTAASCSTRTFTLTPAMYNLNPGNYSAEITQQTSCGNIVVSNPFTVFALPVVSVSPSSTSICLGTPIALTASGAVTYTWSPATGLTPSTGSIVSANPTIATTYTVTGTNGNGCKGTTKSTVSINALPIVQMPNLELCPGECVLPNFAAGITGGTPYINGTIKYYEYLVTGPNGFEFRCSTLPGNISGSSCDGETPFCSAGTYTVTAWGPNNCKGSGTFTISVINLPVLTATNGTTSPGGCVNVATLIGYDPANLKSGESITVVNNTTGATVLSCTQPGCSFQLCPTQTTSYTATFKKVAPSGKVCQKSVTFTIDINFEVKIYTTCSSSSPCNGTAVAIVTKGIAPYTYLWSTGATTSNVSGLCAGSYNVTVKDATGGGQTYLVIISSGSLNPITGTTNFDSFITNGLIYVGGMSGWTNATLYINNTFFQNCDNLNENNPDYAINITPSSVNANGYIDIKSLLPSYNRFYYGYTYVYMTFTNNCNKQTQGKCLYYQACEPLCGTLSNNVSPNTSGVSTYVPPVRVCIADPLTINWSCNKFLGNITLTIAEIEDPTYEPNALFVPNTSKTFTFTSVEAVPDLKTIFTFNPNRWYHIGAKGFVGGCNEEGVTSISMSVKTVDCSTCSIDPSAFTASFAGLPTFMDPGQSVQLNSFVNPTNGSYNYEWTFSRDGFGTVNGGGTLTPPTSNNTTFTTYASCSPCSTSNFIHGYVTLKVTDGQGCTATAQRKVYIYPPKSTSPVVEPATDITSGIQNEEQRTEQNNTLHVMPNPNNGSFNVFVDSEKEKNLYIYDMTGKIVFEKTKTMEQTFYIDISQLSKGIYLVRVSDGATYQVKKVIVD